MEQHSDLLLVTLSTDMIKNNLSTKRFNGDAVLLEGNRTLNPSMSVLTGNRNNKVRNYQRLNGPPVMMKPVERVDKIW